MKNRKKKIQAAIMAALQYLQEEEKANKKANTSITKLLTRLGGKPTNQR